MMCAAKCLSLGSPVNMSRAALSRAIAAQDIPGYFTVWPALRFIPRLPVVWAMHLHGGIK